MAIVPEQPEGTPDGAGQLVGITIRASAPGCQRILGTVPCSDQPIRGRPVPRAPRPPAERPQLVPLTPLPA